MQMFPTEYENIHYITQSKKFKHLGFLWLIYQR